MTLDVKGICTGKLRRRRAFVYIMREERPYGIPASSYLSICGQGYRFFGFPVDKLPGSLSVQQRKDEAP